MLKENFNKVENHIQKICDRKGIDRSTVTLIAVSKTKPVEMLNEIYDAGCRDFGENKVQELADKYEVMPKDIRWHMIGHLQRNKVKYIIDKVRLAETIEKEAAKKNCDIDILLEVNMAREESKYGVFPEDIYDLLEKISKFPHIHVKGLMTVAPYVDDPEDNRVVFEKMRKLSVDIESKKIDNIIMSVLSMGMTNDYEIALEEGADMVRVGTAIFGERNYH